MVSLPVGVTVTSPVRYTVLDQVSLTMIGPEVVAAFAVRAAASKKLAGQVQDFVFIGSSPSRMPRATGHLETGSSKRKERVLLTLHSGHWYAPTETLSGTPNWGRASIAVL
jgi:hypothetical protein